MDKQLFTGNQVQSNRVLYTPSVFAKSSLIYLQETGELTALKPHVSRREQLNSYLFFIVLDGLGSVQYDNKEVHLRPGDCVFFNCQKPYSHASSTEQLWRLKWVHFYGPNMDSIYEKFLDRGGTWYFTTSKPARYENLLEEIFLTANADSPVRDMKLYEKLVRLLTLTMEESGSHSLISDHQEAAQTKLNDIKKYIDEHFTEKIYLDALSERFYINKYYLTRLFKKQFGASINHYIIYQRITLGKRLLRFTDDSIENISRECGIDDPGYFTRLFKKIEGITPGEFRKRWVK